MPETKQAYGYLRVSSMGQVDKSGFDRQKKRILSFAAENKFQIKNFYQEEGVSGTKSEVDRPAFQEMLTAILSNCIKTVIVESLDRLAREYRIQEQILIYLIGHGIELIAANTGENITEAIMDDPMRRAIVQMQGIFSELDKSLIVKKLGAAREKIRKEKGKCEGAKRFGEIDSGEKSIVRKMVYLRRRSKRQSKPLSYKKIAGILNKEGIKTKRNKQFSPMTVFNVLNK